MTSPDVRPYVDLTLYDRSAQQIFATALADALVKLPGWVPREGNTEVVLLEALALEVSELVFAVNRAPGAIMEVLLRLFGLAPSAGAPATADVTFTLSDMLGHDVPAGTRLRLLPPNGAEAVDFLTVEALAVPPGQNVGTVGAVATVVGKRAHSGTVGQTLQILDAVVFVDSAVLATSPGGGEEPESALDFLDRGVQRLSRLVTTLVLPEHFAAAALEVESVERAFALDNYDPGQAGSPGDHGGHVTVAVATTGGASLPALDKANLEVELEASAQANLDVHVIDPTVTTVNVTATVKRLAGWTDAQVLENVTAVLEEYLSPDTWPWSGTVRYNELIARIDRAAGVDYVVSITTPNADVALAGVAPLADLGAVNLTIQAP